MPLAILRAFRAARRALAWRVALSARAQRRSRRGVGDDGGRRAVAAWRTACQWRAAWPRQLVSTPPQA